MTGPPSFLRIPWAGGTHTRHQIHRRASVNQMKSKSQQSQLANLGGIPVLPHRLRNSFSSPLAPSPTASPRIKPDLYLSLASSKYPAASLVSAATIRLAGTNVNLSRLALPSPEQEYTDPMKGVSVVVPGVHPDDSPNELVMTPVGQGKSCSRFLEGRQCC